MKLPDAIVVGPIRYTVSTDRAELNAAAIEMNGALMGHSDHMRQTITLHDELGPDAIVETLWHEVMHAVFEVTAVVHDLDQKQAESMILRLSPAIVDVLRRNPDLAALVTDREPSRGGRTK